MIRGEKWAEGVYFLFFPTIFPDELSGDLFSLFGYHPISMANLPVFAHLTSDVHLKANYIKFPSKTSDIGVQVKNITSDVKTSNRHHCQ